MSQALYDLFCRNVRARMEELAMSQSELANSLGTTPSFVSQILSQHRRPGLDTLEKFAKALKTTPSALIEKKSAQKV